MAGIRDVGPMWLHTSHMQRHPVAVDGVTGTSSGTVEATINVPAFWDDFWDNVQDTTNGYDIVVTNSDGVTVLTYDLSGFSAANRTCTIRISGLALNATTKMTMIWLYWNRESAPDQTGSPTTASPITAYVYLGLPAGSSVVVARHDPPGVTVPTQKVTHDPAAVSHLWWDITGTLSRQGEPYNGGHGLEGPLWATATVDPATATSADASTRFTYHNGRLWVRQRYSGGGSGNDSTATLTIATTDGRTLVFKAGIDIQTLAV